VVGVKAAQEKLHVNVSIYISDIPVESQNMHHIKGTGKSFDFSLYIMFYLSWPYNHTVNRENLVRYCI
jgi:hypothetical protein